MKSSSKILLTVTVAGLAGTALWLLWPHKATTIPKAATVAHTVPAPAPAALEVPAEPVTSARAAALPTTPLPVPASAALPATPVPISAVVAGPTPSATAATPAPAMAPIAPAAPEKPNEMAASARMYAAHASLRAPEVADPDSSSNRQILQTMVLKALARHLSQAELKDSGLRTNTGPAEAGNGVAVTATASR